MRKMKLHNMVFTIVLLLSLSACAPQLAQVAFGNGSWIDKPLPNSNLPLGSHEVVSHASSKHGIASFELSVDGQVVAMNDVPGDAFGQTLAYVTQLWNPTAPGVYELSIRAMDLEGEFGPTTSIMVSVVDDLAVEEAAPPTEEEETVVPTEEAGACTFEAVVNIFCRLGTDTRFEPVDSFTPGQTAPVVGMSSDGFYWYVLGPLSGQMCTVPSAERYGFTTGDCSSLPSFTPMPTPADTPTSTVEPTPTLTATPTVTPIPPPK